ncbi:MAG: hypothetical protein CMC70_09460 [Flavobacteriaceae bacterium]|nr:hypothetical protein [Flavobacteriaceae bacterium]
MKKTITLKIADPCHEDWAKMTPTQKGKHCQVCSKEVIDFTEKTDEAIVAHVLKNKHACGRFITSQLERELTLERKSGHRFTPIAASLLVPFTLLASNFSISAKKREPSKQFTSLHIGSLHKHTMQIGVKGVVYSFNGKPIQGVNVTVKETGKTTQTAHNGEYSIQLQANQTLVYSYRGYSAVEVPVGTVAMRKDVMLQKEDSTQNSTPLRMGKVALRKTVSATSEITATSTVKITGTVVDNSGLPLPGVNVLIKGTTKGIQTDFDGQYVIESQPNQTLIFIYVAFKTKEVAISTISNTINVTLHEDAQLLDEILVGGFSMYESGPTIKPFGNKEGGYYSLSAKERQQRKLAQRNTNAFIKIKKDRKKAERKAKRNERKDHK